jgi:tRNA dimethylallyltransferase
MGNKLLVICGPTATGKTQLGVNLAKKFGGEIVSADSRQIYKGMDIATGKDLPSEAKFHSVLGKTKFGIGYYLFDRVPVWMLDVVLPNHPFSVADFHEIAHGIIENIWRRGKLPIIVGGTGLYIKAMIDGIETLGIPPNPQLRMAYTGKSVQELFDILFHLNPETANKLNNDDRQNKRRLIRKIEIAQAGVKITKKMKEWRNLDVLCFGLVISSQKLYERINRRIDEWVKGGAVEEVGKLLAMGYSWNLPAMSGIGYRQWRPYFEGKTDLSQVLQKWKFDEHAYARRQMTWFKKDKRIHWFDISGQKWENRVEKLVSWWTKKK